MTTDTRANLKRKSHVVSQGPSRAAARAMLRAVGLNDEDMEKPFVSIANLAQRRDPLATCISTGSRPKLKRGSGTPNAVPFLFGTITVSDGISMGTEGNEGLSGEPGGYRRFHRDRHVRREHGRPDRRGRL